MASTTANDAINSTHKSRSHTNFKVEMFNHEWTISNFSFCQAKLGDALISSTFLAGRNNKDQPLKWYLKMYPKGPNEEHKDYLSLYLQLSSIQEAEVKAKFKLGIINNVQERVNVHVSSGIWNFCKKREGSGWLKFIKQNDLLDTAEKFMQDDKLTVFCDIEIVTEVSTTTENIDEMQSLEPKCYLLANIGNLLESKKFSDVILTVCGTEFHAHKTILAAHSPVFSAMFQHEMEEKKQNRVDIDDIDEEVLKEMLLFLYTGEVTNIKKVALGLLAAADKYAIESLKIASENALLSNLTIENAADILIAADLHGADNLKPRVLDFISNNAIIVMTTEGLKSMVQTHPNLVAEVLGKLTPQQNTNSRKDVSAKGSTSKRNVQAME